jgi:uncharacterized protein
MSTDLPAFRYHPDPLASGAIEPSDVECACCGKKRGFIYVGPVYGEHDLNDLLCPWCISDGSAVRKFDARFADDHPLRKANLAEHIVEEVSLRTPAFNSWQQEQWYAHCGDACAFHGDATVEEVANATTSTKAAWREEFGLTDEDWALATKNYHPRGPQAFYKFVCLHCGTVLLGWDCS